MCRQLLLLTSLTPLLLSIANAQGTVVVTDTIASETVTCTRFRETGFWDVDIYNYPTLPRACGPPLSYNAIRDKSALPYQISALVGSYVFFLAATGTLLLTWGRKMRKAAENATGPPKEYEMVNASKYGLSSPAPSQRSWMKHPFKTLKRQSSMTSKSDMSPISPGVESVNSFDVRILQRDRESAQQEMDRLYAAVMQHEEAKRSQTRISHMESRDSLRSTATGATDAITQAPPPKHLSVDSNASKPGKGLRVQIAEQPANRPVELIRESYLSAPKSPYKALHPPAYPQSPGGFSFVSGHTQITPPTPGRVELPNDMYPASPPPKQVRMQLPPPKSAGGDSGSSIRSKKLSSIKNLRISSSNDDRDAEDRQPLTPGIPQNPPAPPALPGYEEPGTARSEMSDTYASERLDEPRPLPSARPIPPPLSLPMSPKANKPQPVAAAGAHNNPLPFRQYASQDSLAPAGGPLSPGPIKQTILERKPDPRMRGPMTAKTPRTGVPMTPYTPYMPFTPITPMTPSLMTRKERKERIKAQGKKVLLEEDEVKDEGDMWDAGY